MKAIISIQGKTYSEFPNLVQGDYGYDIYFNVKNNDSTVFTLNGYSAKFKARKYGEDTNQIDGSCIVTNMTSGICKYTLVTSDLEISGRFETELECTLGSTSIISAKLGDLIVVDEL